jgi:Glycosyl hydrolase catalytic core
MKQQLFLLVCFVGFLASCKKDSDNGNGTTVQPFEPGNTLVVSKGGNVAEPRIQLNADTVYSNVGIGPMFKALPAGFDDAITSFYLPKGYMAVFAENSDGSGESACYVAAQSPVRLNFSSKLLNKISFIRYMAIVNSGRKGVAFTDSNVVKQFSTSWYYGWSINRPSFGAQQFMPMTWGKGSATAENVNYLVGRKDVNHLMSFNEPDNATQSNIPIIDTATTRFKVMLQAGVRTVSPAVTQDQAFGAGRWLTRFMDAANVQGLRVDVVALHWYDWGNQTNNLATDSLTGQAVFNRFKTYVENARNAYPNQKIWITEFNANPNRASVVVHKYFMKLATDWMNATSYVERYAYFFPAVLPATDAGGALTDAGMYWNSLSSPAAFLVNVE